MEAQPVAENNAEPQPAIGVLDCFIYYTESFLNAVGEAFDDCRLLQEKRDQFDAIVRPYRIIQEQLCRGYHNQMKDYYDACTRRDPTPFLTANIEILRDIDFKSKYEEMSDRTLYTEEQIQMNLNNLWDYILEMNKYAQLFNQIPSQIISRIERMALQIAHDITDGGKSPDDLDLLDIGRLVVEDARSSDISELMGNMGQIFNALGGMGAFKGIIEAGVKPPKGPDITHLLALAARMSSQTQPQQAFVAATTDPAPAPGADAVAATAAVGHDDGDRSAEQGRPRGAAARVAWKPPPM